MKKLYITERLFLMIDFTIMEYNIDTRRFVVLGYIKAKNSEEAKATFSTNNGWEATDKTLLFAKPPLCR